ncbi:MAG: hypothetical protein ACM3O7_00860 [Acidobacteriota bacterium]
MSAFARGSTWGTVVLTAVAALFATACGSPAVPPVAERTFAHPESGYRFVAPPHWQVMRGEVRSPNATLITIQVLALDDAEESFVKGLPGTIVPQLEAWAKYYFRVVGAPVQRPTTLAGQPALEVTYPVRVRETDAPGQVSYWVAVHSNRIYIIRVSVPARSTSQDDAGLREFLASWQFTTPTGGSDQGPAGTFVLSIPKKPS